MGLESPDYMRHIGGRLMQQGYTVVCPFFPHAGNLVSVAKLGLHLAAQGISFHNIVVMSALACIEVALKYAAAGPVYCYGVSIGALIGLHASLLDDRVEALVLSGLVREDETLLRQGVLDSMLERGVMYPPTFNPLAWRYGLEKTLNLWAPRPLFIEVGLDDDMSGVAQGRDRVLETFKSTYALKGWARNFEFEIFPGGHEAYGGASLVWINSLHG